MNKFTNGQAVITVTDSGKVIAKNAQGVTISLANLVFNASLNGDSAKKSACADAAREGVVALSRVTGQLWLVA